MILDVIIVGGGIGGLNSLKLLIDYKLETLLLEEGDGIGGAWFWNRYPGARCDMPSFEYSFKDSKLDECWKWSERFSKQSEINEYLNNFVRIHNLNDYILLRNKVEHLKFDNSKNCWKVEATSGLYFAKFVLFAGGPLNHKIVPDFAKNHTFSGQLLYTARWPKESIDFQNKSVAIIGTGSSGVQCLSEISRNASKVYVLQRTASYCVPARNYSILESHVLEWNEKKDVIRSKGLETGGGFYYKTSNLNILSLSPMERKKIFDLYWDLGGFNMFGAFCDTFKDKNANDILKGLFHAKIISIVKDPLVAKSLCPHIPVFSKRLCVGYDYYENFNKENVCLIDISKNSIKNISEDGINLCSGKIIVDIIICATGFDAFTGSLTSIAIEGLKSNLESEWESFPHNFLGIMANGFPNFFYLNGPGSPGTLSNGFVFLQKQSEIVCKFIHNIIHTKISYIEARISAEAIWEEKMKNLIEEYSVVYGNDSQSYYVGSNVNGKTKQFILYKGGLNAYFDELGRLLKLNQDHFLFY